MTGRPPTGIKAVQEMFESASNPSGTRPAAGIRTVISSGRRISWDIWKCRQPHARPIGRGGLYVEILLDEGCEATEVCSAGRGSRDGKVGPECPRQRVAVVSSAACHP